MPNPPTPPPGKRPATFSPFAQIPADELRARYNLPPLPATVGKIAGLVEKHQSASMDEITNIIGNDAKVTQRLMITAFPKPGARTGATMQMATARLGVARVISLIVGEMLTDSVTSTFQTMVGLEMKPEDVALMPRFEAGVLLGSVKFTGAATGEVTVAFSHLLSVMIVSKLTGGNIDDKFPREVINDAIGEIVNIITGNLQSRLADAGMSSEVRMPVVEFKPNFPSVTILGGSSDRFLFRQGAHYLGVNLCIAPLTRK